MSSTFKISVTISFFARLLYLFMMVQVATSHADPLIRTSRAQTGTDRLIVKLKDSYKTEYNQSLSRERTSALSTRAGLRLQSLRPMSGNAHVLGLGRVMQGAELATTLERLRADPSVEYAEADTREYLLATPNDPFYTAQQYYLKAPTTASPATINAASAWDVTTGSASTVMALIDGGVRFDHPDLAGQLLNGYDFVSADCSTDPASPIYDSGCTASNMYTTANDHDGRDADASDPGDGYTAAEFATNPILSNCDTATGETSSWHGTHVAGIVGARTNNLIGVAGINWNIRMLPVRVLGRCGGYSSDIIDGMRWAVGIAVPGVPNNTTPAKVLNLSLGGTGACTTAYNQAIADVMAQGAIVVAAAGNEDGAVGRPANCSGVIAVGAVRPDGSRATYSNSGAGLSLMAPGGDANTVGGVKTYIGLITSTNNAGNYAPQAYTSAGDYAYGAGTSFATPMVSGTVALMLALNPNLTAQNAKDILTQTARPFVAVSGLGTCVAGGTNNADNTTPCNCTTAACGAGYLDAAAAVARVQALLAPAVPITPVAASSSGGGGGGNIDALSLALLMLLAVALRQKRQMQIKTQTEAQ